MGRRTKGRRTASPDATELQAALEAAFPDGRWLRVLELFLPTGVADAGQIRQTTGLSRDQLDGLLARFRELAGEAILKRVPFAVPRPGRRGRPPAVYTLGEAGAALLRANGHPDAHPCGLNDPRALAHARATLDVRLAALAAGLAVETERELPYEAHGRAPLRSGNDTGSHDHATLRPDNLVTLPDGTRALFETEQAADLTLLRRIVEGVRRKAVFFQSDAARGISPAVRVLINLPRGPAWEKTVRVWERATAIVAEEQDGDLPFRLLAMPLSEFLDRPDWSEPPDEARWEPLFDPAQTSTFEPPVPSPQGNPPARRKARLPRSLRRRAPADDRRILLAYWQHLLEQGPDLAYTADHPRPDPAFFEVMGVIYAASHPADAPVVHQAAYPYASVYLLRKYLQMHPRLRQALSKGMVRGGGSMRWNVTTILHRMQVVIETFLRYHGYRVGRAVEAVPVSPWDRTDGPRDFGVAVRICPEVLVGEGDGVVPGREEVRAAEEALAWVLWALFAYAEEVGLKRPPFW